MAWCLVLQRQVVEKHMKLKEKEREKEGKRRSVTDGDKPESPHTDGGAGSPGKARVRGRSPVQRYIQYTLLAHVSANWPKALN